MKTDLLAKPFAFLWQADLNRPLKLFILGSGAFWLLAASIAFVVILVKTQEISEGYKGIRLINVPGKDCGYSNFESMLFHSQKELESFFDEIAIQENWGDRSGFVTSIKNAKTDFTKECLVLIRHTEDSTSVKVWFDHPISMSGRIHCSIRTESPYLCNRQMGYYCFAFAVEKDRGDLVEVSVDGVVEQFLTVKRK